MSGIVLILPVIVLVLVSQTANVLGAPPEIIPPEECTTAPLSKADLLSAASASPVARDVAQDTVLDGEPGDATTVDGITQTIRESVACANANEPLRAYALFSPDYLKERFGGNNKDDLGHLIAALSRDPAVAAPEDRLALVSIEDVRMLKDGSVAASVETENANEHFVDDVALIRVGERWLIDRVVPGNATAVATSVP